MTRLEVIDTAKKANPLFSSVRSSRPRCCARLVFPFLSRLGSFELKHQIFTASPNCQWPVTGSARESRGYTKSHKKIKIRKGLSELSLLINFIFHKIYSFQRATVKRNLRFALKMSSIERRKTPAVIAANPRHFSPGFVFRRGRGRVFLLFMPPSPVLSSPSRVLSILLAFLLFFFCLVHMSLPFRIHRSSSSPCRFRDLLSQCRLPCVLRRRCAASIALRYALPRSLSAYASC